MADALIAKAVANLMMRARRARRGSHSYAIQRPSGRKESMGKAESPSLPHRAHTSRTLGIAKRSAATIFAHGGQWRSAMRQFFEDIALDDGIEIISPPDRKAGSRCAVICLCCQRSDQSMDDDGCGICDTCLGTRARAANNPDGLEFPDALSHLTFTTRNR